jgi:hypothetical protein
MIIIIIVVVVVTEDGGDGVAILCSYDDDHAFYSM